MLWFKHRKKVIVGREGGRDYIVAYAMCCLSLFCTAMGSGSSLISDCDFNHDAIFLRHISSSRISTYTTMILYVRACKQY